MSESLWTVIMLLPDYMADTFGHDRDVFHVNAENKGQAIAAARQIAEEQNCYAYPDCGKDFHVLGVIRGHHEVEVED